MIRDWCVVIMCVCSSRNAMKRTKERVPVKCGICGVEHSVGRLSSNAASVFIISGASTVKSLNSIDGKEEWASELGGEIVSNIVAARERLYVVTSSITANGVSAKVFTLRGLSLSTGLPVSSATLPTAESFRLIVEEEIVVALGTAGSVNAFDQSGSALWNFAIGGKITADPIAFRSGITLAAEEDSAELIPEGDTTSGNPARPRDIARTRCKRHDLFG